jgi:regulator of replication initiation timing
MPDEVDQALTVIYRELESVTALRQDLAALQDQCKTAEQARRILEGLLALERQGHEAVAQKDAEINALKGQLEELRTAHDSLVLENNLLQQRIKDEANTSKAGLEEVQALKASLRRLLGE